MAISAFTAFLTIFLVASITTADRVRQQDPYIICPSGTDVPTNRNGLPAGYNPITYYNTMQLCSALNGASKNLGCVCTNSNSNSLTCHEAVADPILWASAVTFTVKTFPTFCQEACHCTDSQDATEDRERAGLEHHYSDERQQTNSPASWHDPSDSNYQIWGSHDQEIEPNQPWSHADTLNKDPVAQDQCGQNCTSNTDCGSGGKGCMCSTQSEQYHPGSGTVAFLAACIISMSGNLPREEARPCPCNSTYVSFGCCGAQDGLVWEGVDFKLGELLTEDEL